MLVVQKTVIDRILIFSTQTECRLNADTYNVERGWFVVTQYFMVHTDREKFLSF